MPFREGVSSGGRLASHHPSIQCMVYRQRRLKLLLFLLQVGARKKLHTRAGDVMAPRIIVTHRRRRYTNQHLLSLDNSSFLCPCALPS